MARELWKDPSLAQEPDRLDGIGPVTAEPLVRFLAAYPGDSGRCGPSVPARSP